MISTAHSQSKPSLQAPERQHMSRFLTHHRQTMKVQQEGKLSPYPRINSLLLKSLRLMPVKIMGKLLSVKSSDSLLCKSILSANSGLQNYRYPRTTSIDISFRLGFRIRRCLRIHCVGPLTKVYPWQTLVKPLQNGGWTELIWWLSPCADFSVQSRLCICFLNCC